MPILNGPFLVPQPIPNRGRGNHLVTMVAISEVGKEAKGSTMVIDNFPLGFAISVEVNRARYQTILD